MVKPTVTNFLFDFSKEIWNETYKNNLTTSNLKRPDKDVNDTFLRIATDLASTEKDSAKWTNLFYEALSEFKCVPGGRITSNAGTGLHGTTYINCFVSGAQGEDQDSIEGIFDALTRAALTLKSEGGYGFCANFIRPEGAFIHGVGVESPGAVEMLKLWDTMSSVITKGSGKKKKNEEGKNKIRKGAMMVTLSTEHPDILNFINAKQTPGVLTKFNMSILVSNKLMNAVKNNLQWELWFPDTTFSEYKKEWDGDFKKWEEKGYPKVVHRTFENANELWDLVMSSTFNRNEPGILFVDRMNELNNLHLTENILATNPCGEQILPIGGVCLLGSLNLTQFINKERSGWDYKKLEHYIPIFVRMLDNVNDRTLVPLEEQRWNLVNKRRIGMGYMGYGSALCLMKVRYGSKMALDLTDELCNFVTNEAYKASALLAKEKGAYPLFNLKEFLSSRFVNQALRADTIELVTKYGSRNSHLASIQPTGNGSVYANNISGGFEPIIFLKEYYRTSTVNVAPDGLPIPSVDWKSKTYFLQGETAALRPTLNEGMWSWTKEGDEDILVTTHEDITYKYDRGRGLVKETLIEDYSVRLLKEYGEWDPTAEWAVDTTKLSVDDHTSTMKVFAKYIDSAMSKTVNLPNDYPYEDFKKLYMDFFDSGVIKGGTTYRSGTMTTVLSATSSKVDPNRITKTTAPKRPKDLDCDVHRLTVDGQKWIVFVGLLGGDPYEVFAGLVDKVDLGKRIAQGKLVKVKQGEYNFMADDEIEVKDVVSIFDNSAQGAITRLVSTSLRHGADIKYIVSQLQKTGNGLNTFSRALARALKKYIKEGDKLDDQVCPNCNSKNLVMSEGCNKCLNCGFSGCS